ncbi:unnamed protein product [Ambrosiozyma monospora]|uniref:Unnamed protein product n=1 Tax=Ambrosiozyma monospora TaxID=43982 RepID=A0ACB5SQX6_AMBMO|nr:unnamed protein product [Ambrosiozyma monospora]
MFCRLTRISENVFELNKFEYRKEKSRWQRPYGIENEIELQANVLHVSSSTLEEMHEMNAYKYKKLRKPKKKSGKKDDYAAPILSIDH